MAIKKSSAARKTSRSGGTLRRADSTVLDSNVQTANGTEGHTFKVESVSHVNDLQFVDGLSNGYRSKETRSHVMKQAYREKRRRLERGENNDPPGSWPVTLECSDPRTLELSCCGIAGSRWTSDVVRAHTPPEELSPTFTLEEDSTTSSDDYQQKGSTFDIDGSGADGDAQAQRVVTWNPTNLQAVLGAGRLNPFSTFPGRHGKKTDQLVDFYVNVDRVLSHGCPVINENEYNFHKDRMRTVQENESSFYAMLVLSANRQATLCNGNPSCDAMTYKELALRAINQSLVNLQETGEPLHDGVLLAVLDLADDELRFGSKEKALTHWNGLTEMVNLRGGLSRLVHNRLLQAVLMWYHMCLGFYQGLLWPSLPVEQRVAMPTSTSVRESFEQSNLQSDYESLVDFLRDVERTILEHPASDLFGVSRQSRTDSKLAVFGPGTIVHGILMSGNELASLGQAFTRQEESIRSKHSCLLPSLLYLCAALMEYVDDAARFWDFIICLNDTVCENNLHFLRCHDKFLLLLLRGIERPTDRRPERAWKVMKLMSAIRRLSFASRQKVCILLQGALGMYGPDVGRFAMDWDPEEFRRELFTIPSDCD